MQDTIVVAGGGHAAAQVVDSLRRDGYAGRLVMVCGEQALPYQRPPLSKKFLGGELEAERLPIRPASFYENIHCELMLGNPVVEIDAKGRKLKLSDGGSLGYDKLVLAIGGHARPLPVPGANLPGVHVLRTMEDVEAIRARIKPGVRVAVVGAGYIGLETRGHFPQARARRDRDRDDGPGDEPRRCAGNERLLPVGAHGPRRQRAHGPQGRGILGLRQRCRGRMHGWNASPRRSRDRRHRTRAQLRAGGIRRASSATTASPSMRTAEPATRTSTPSATAAATRARATGAASASNPSTTPSSRRSPRPRTSAARKCRTTRRRGSGRINMN